MPALTNVLPAVAAIVAAALPSPILPGQEAPTKEAAANAVRERIEQTIALHAYAMTVSPNGLAGPGGELVLREAARVDFLGIGESHLNNETPAFVRAMLPALKDAGYGAFAIETGERIADFFQRSVAKDRAALAQFFAATPLSGAFIDRVPEFDLCAQAAELGMDLWGLDQVFVGGARFNLGELVRLAPGERAKAVAERHLQRAIAGLKRFMQSRDRSAAYLASATPDDYRELRAAFAGVPEGLRIADEMERSAHIYRLYNQGANYESNRVRIELMRRHLAERVRAMPEGNKVALKFGSSHVGRSYSLSNQLDLGAAMIGLGDYFGNGSLHLLVAAPSQSTAGDTTITERAILDAMGDNDWTVFDLRPLRPIFHRKRNRAAFEDLNDRVWRYDLMVLTKEFTRAKPLPGVPDFGGR